MFQINIMETTTGQQIIKCYELVNYINDRNYS